MNIPENGPGFADSIIAICNNPKCGEKINTTVSNKMNCNSWIMSILLLIVYCPLLIIMCFTNKCKDFNSFLPYMPTKFRD